MSELIAVKIDVTKIEKARLFAGKNGAKYLDVMLIPTPNDRFGNSHMVTQSISKEEREAGKKGPILGNAKILGGGYRRPVEQKPKPENKPAQSSGPDEDVPF